LKLGKMLDKMNYLTNTFKNFTTGVWIYLMGKTDDIIMKMTEEDMREFCVDVNEIDWEKLIRNFAHGLRTNILKEDTNELPRQDENNIIQVFKVFYNYRNLKG
jgi:hypothetical protein